MDSYLEAYKAGWENITDHECTSNTQPAFVSTANVRYISRSKLKDPVLTFLCLLTQAIWQIFFNMFVDSLATAQAVKTRGK